MSLDSGTRDRIAGLIRDNEVMLFMKGTPDAPGCGFSAQVVQILSRLLPDFGSLDVLADPEVRQGIKEFSDWPTIPQLYVRGEFMGGCDIVKEMYASGELHTTLGLEAAAIAQPTIDITDAAAALIRKSQESSAHKALHVVIDEHFQHQLGFGPPQPGEISVEAAGFKLLLDRDSALRADGLVIDVSSGEQGEGLAVHNPNSPGERNASAVKQLSVQELKALLDRGQRLHLFDVRTVEEHARAAIRAARLVDEEVLDEIERLPKDAMIVFHCHHGGRSQAAAEHFAGAGFTNVHNLAGGIDAWSSEIDSSVPRY